MRRLRNIMSRAIAPNIQKENDMARRNTLPEDHVNPTDVSLADFLKAFADEKNDRGWCETADTYLRRTGLVAAHPQWDEATKSYNALAPNPESEYGDRIPTDVLLGKVKKVHSDYTQETDAVLARVGVKYREYNDTFKITATIDVDSQFMRRQYGRDYVPADPNNLTQQDLRNLLYAFGSGGAIDKAKAHGGPTVEVTPDPARAQTGTTATPAA